MSDEHRRIPTRTMVGGTAKDNAAEFLDAWHRVERGEHVEPQPVLSFESREALAGLLSGERLRLLRFVRQHPEPSILALSKALGRIIDSITTIGTYLPLRPQSPLTGWSTVD